MVPKRSSSSNGRVLRSALKPRAVCPPSTKSLSSAVGVGGKSAKEYRGKAPAAASSPNFLESLEPTRYPQRKRRTSVVASGGKSGYPKDNSGKAPATGSLSRCRPNSAPFTEVRNLSGGGGRGAPPSCTAAKAPILPETFPFNKIDVPNEAWWWKDPLDPWIDAKVVDLPKAWYWNHPLMDYGWEEETEDLTVSDLDKHKQK